MLIYSNLARRAVVRTLLYLQSLGWRCLPWLHRTEVGLQRLHVQQYLDQGRVYVMRERWVLTVRRRERKSLRSRDEQFERARALAHVQRSKGPGSRDCCSRFGASGRMIVAAEHGHQGMEMRYRCRKNRTERRNASTASEASARMASTASNGNTDGRTPLRVPQSMLFEVEAARLQATRR